MLFRLQLVKVHERLQGIELLVFSTSLHLNLGLDLQQKFAVQELLGLIYMFDGLLRLVYL